MVYGFLRGQGIRDYGLIIYQSFKGQGYLGVGILYGTTNLSGESEKQMKINNDESCVIYEDVYEYVEKIWEKGYFS
jgi:hypothetical protein